MKVLTAVRKRCPNCKFVRRKKRLYVRCNVFPRHKQRQGFSTMVTHDACLCQFPVLEGDQSDGIQLLVMNAFNSHLIR